MGPSAVQHQLHEPASTAPALGWADAAGAKVVAVSVRTVAASKDATRRIGITFVVVAVVLLEFIHWNPEG